MGDTLGSCISYNAEPCGQHVAYLAGALGLTVGLLRDSEPGAAAR